MVDECFYCKDTGYIPGKEGELPGDKLPDQMCPHCEIGQAVIKGFNAARDIGIQACNTLKEAKDERITELEEIYLGQIRVIARSRITYKEKVERMVALAEQALKD